MRAMKTRPLNLIVTDTNRAHFARPNRFGMALECGGHRTLLLGHTATLGVAVEIFLTSEDFAEVVAATEDAVPCKACQKMAPRVTAEFQYREDD